MTKLLRFFRTCRIVLNTGAPWRPLLTSGEWRSLFTGQPRRFQWIGPVLISWDVDEVSR